MNVPDVFGLHKREPTERQIDAGAKVLRERQQGGKKLTPWENLPSYPKKKWHDHAEAVLRAALNS